MSVPNHKSSKQEKIALLKKLVESEDVFYDNQSTFQAYLSDHDPEVRILAIQGLWDYPDPDLIDPLVDIAQRDPDQQVRNRAITALGRYVYEGEMADYDYDWGELETVIREDELPEESYRRVVAFLLEMARDPSVSLDERRFSIEALGFSSDPEIIDLLEQAYHAPDVEMKVSALFAMGRSGLVQWDDYILAELDSPISQIQLEAVRAAGELFLDEATPALLALASSATDQNLRHEAIWALGHMTSIEVWQFLDDLTQDPLEDEETRQLADAALDEYEMFQELTETDYETDYGLYEDNGLAQERNGGGNGYFNE
jgi:HEAT repeat protein